ncbi:hypothetical protein CTAYLR_010338 [Chrysophaeum taylorii]|uniref:DNA-directed RNA polymerase RBP11-like dimerisation domain-containing protein n=1 Tax=Chrysophaeum taylorii TaxID=2483200 RepID=A0AAD7UJU4_9STRA|nr:hypothetical protein CTAYLR_010338 [Chrysophaeum taylorii]
MNAPERHKAYLLEDDEARVEYAKDQKIPNAGLFTIYKEDHTIGNLVRMQLLRDSDVRFAGYKLPHPLEHRCLVKVQTTGAKPKEVFLRSISDLHSEFDYLDRYFREEVLRFKEAT